MFQKQLFDEQTTDYSFPWRRFYKDGAEISILFLCAEHSAERISAKVW